MRNRPIVYRGCPAEAYEEKHTCGHKENDRVCQDPATGIDLDGAWVCDRHRTQLSLELIVEATGFKP
jgi:hypothetical protein